MSTDILPLLDEAPSALPPGTRLGEFELVRVLGVGGFGIVYLAFDHALEREVAIKEYLPTALAGRTQALQVSLRSAADADTFAQGLRSFVNEARLLARFDHPALLKVHRFWQANGTAYMAMPVLPGRTLKQLRQSMQGPPDERWLRALLEPLLGAIERLHAEGVYHRDIAPDNIQIGQDGRPVLMDFGAARRVIGDAGPALTAILKPSYAPIEQYAEGGADPQGPWTDLYALGATLHYLLLARPPAPATARALHDDSGALTAAALPGTSTVFVQLVQWMLAPHAADRPQSVAAVRDVLAGRKRPPRLRTEGTAPAQVPVPTPPTPTPAPTPTPWQSTRLVERGIAADIELPLGEPPASTAPRQALAPTVPGAAPARRSAPPRRGLQAVVAGCGVAVAALSFAAYALWPAPPVAADAARAVPRPAAAADPAPAAVAAPPPEVAVAASPAVAESTITTVVVPRQRPQPVEPVAMAAVAGGTGPSVAPVRQAADPGAARRGVQAPSATASLRDVAAATARPTAAAAVPAAATEVPGAAAPEAQCSGRNAVGHFVCMERACLRSELAAHADCLRWRREARRE